jgi:hypothetical protein
MKPRGERVSWGGVGVRLFMDATHLVLQMRRRGHIMRCTAPLLGLALTGKYLYMIAARPAHPSNTSMPRAPPFYRRRR